MLIIWSLITCFNLCYNILFKCRPPPKTSERPTPCSSATASLPSTLVLTSSQWAALTTLCMYGNPNYIQGGKPEFFQQGDAIQQHGQLDGCGGRGFQSKIDPSGCQLHGLHHQGLRPHHLYSPQHAVEPSVLECAVMENWKLQFLDENIVTAGDLGRVNFFDTASK